MTVTRTHTYPANTAPGVYTITATDGVNTAQAQITILDPTANTVVLDPSSVAAGASVSITGEGYPASTTGLLTITPTGGGDPIISQGVTTNADGDVPATSVQIPLDAAAGTYTVTITVDAEFGTATLTVTAPQQLAAPTGVTPGTATDTTIPVTWTAVTNANRYLVQYRVTGTTTWSSRPTVTATTDTITGLTAGTEYDIQVIAQDSGGVYADSNPSAVVTASTTGGVPQLSPPANLAVGTTTSTSIQLNWDTNTDAVGYIVQYRVAGTTPWTQRTQVATNTDTVTGLTPGEDYEFQAKAVGDGTNFTDSDYGPTTPVTGTASQQLATPADLAAGTPTATTMPLTWTAVPNATAYHVQYKLTSAGTWTDFTPNPTAANATVTGLTASTSYDFRVLAVGDGAGFTDSAYAAPVTESTTA